MPSNVGLKGALLCLVVAVPLACGETDDTPGGHGSHAGGQAGAAGRGGSSGHTGTGGAASEGGSAGSAGSGGSSAGDGGSTNEGGNAGSGGNTNEGGSAGDGGSTSEGGNGGEGGVDPLPDPPNMVFVTSQSYLPSEIGGLSGADDKCNDLAAAAEFDGTFVAWLSTSTVDAKDRIGEARGWRNTAFSPFADEREELVAGQVYFPIARDENGEIVQGKVATGTTASGVAAEENCDDWTSSDAADALVTGEPSAGSALWTEDSAADSCADEYHLYCFQTDHDSPQFPTPSQGRTIFVSAQPFTLGAGGRGAADALCASEADAADLSGTYVALLGTSTESALARLVQPSRPWVRPDGMPVATSTTWLGIPALPVPVTEQANGEHAGGVLVFGAADVADPPEFHCENWTNPAAAVPAVVHGRTGYTDERWYAAQTGACSETAHVLCVEQ
jgi:hypothetical protein